MFIGEKKRILTRRINKEKYKNFFLRALRQRIGVVIGKGKVNAL